MKRSSFLKRLAAGIGVAIAAPAVLATEIKSIPKPPDQSIPSCAKNDHVIIVHDYYLKDNLGVDGGFFILPLSSNTFGKGDIISSMFPNVPFLYIESDPFYDKNYDCWEYKVVIIQGTYRPNNLPYPRKFAQPGTRFWKVCNALPIK